MKTLVPKVATVALVLLAGAILRLWDLGERPMHADEAVQGMKFVKLLETGDYRYDPRHFHGPTLYYLTLPIAWLRGQSDGAEVSATTLRLLPAIGGLFLMLAPMLWWRRMGFTGMLLSCALLAFSPGLAYYSRYYIQEILFVTFVLLALLAGWRAVETHGRAFSMLAGVCAGLAIATKETWILVALAGALAWLIASLPKPKNERRPRMNGRFIWLMLGAMATTVILFYTSFGKNPAGIIDSLRTFFVYRPVEGHDKDVGYYLRLLSGGPARDLHLGEWPLVVGFVIAAGVLCVELRRRGWKIDFAEVFFGTFTLVYLGLLHLFAYKTPWMILLPLATGAIFCGVAIGQHRFRDGRLWPARMIAIIVIPCASVSAWWTVMGDPLSASNPYAYAPTLPEALELIHSLDAAVSPKGTVHVILENYWPLPWYLRDRPHVGYWQEPPEAWSAPHAIIADAAYFDEIQRKLNGRLRFEFYQWRTGQYLVLWTEL